VGIKTAYSPPFNGSSRSGLYIYIYVYIYISIHKFIAGINTPYSPPFNGTSRSGFIVDVSVVKEKLTEDQETEIRLVNTERIQAVIADTIYIYIHI
jgi:hypothetical protein